MLDGFENLAKDAVVAVGGTTLTELTDLNLETKLSDSACSAGASCEIKITLAGGPIVWGIYKVIIYGPSESSDVSGWQVKFCRNGKVEMLIKIRLADFTISS